MTMVVNIRFMPFDIYIGRPTKRQKDLNYKHFGNPFSHKLGTSAIILVNDREEAIKQFRRWLLGEDWTTLCQQQRQWILDNMYRLKGKTLGCWCKPQLCHGDVLKELVDEL